MTWSDMNGPYPRGPMVSFPAWRWAVGHAMAWLFHLPPRVDVDYVAPTTVANYDTS